MYSIVPTRRRRPGYSLSPYSFPFNSIGTIGGMSGFGSSSPLAMRTDISETEDSFEFKVELPGFSKENVSAELQEGYLVISATTQHSTDDSSETEPATSTGETECTCTEEKSCGCETEQTTSETESQPTWRRRERYFGSCRRMYYVGEDIDEEGVSAKFENGLLSVSVPKQLEKEEQKKQISIS